MLRDLCRLAFVVVAVGCGAHARDPHQPPPTPVRAVVAVPAAPGPTPQLVALRARADQSLAASWPLDYDRPMTSHADDRPATTALYVEACHGGDKQACWIAATTDGWSAATTASVHDSCVAGDLLSCRALPPDAADAAAPAFPDAPGWVGRSAACLRPTWLPGGPGCDVVALRRECILGFPYSCRLISARDNEETPDREALQARARELARDGCRARIHAECGEQMVGASAVDEREIYERMCPLKQNWCGNLSLLVQDAGELVRARDLAERVCQYGAADSADACLKLGQAYLQGELPEPSAGRGEALITWACSQPRMTNFATVCAQRAKRPGARSAPR